MALVVLVGQRGAWRRWRGAGRRRAVGDVLGLAFQDEHAFTQSGGLLVGAMLPQPGTHRSRLGVSLTPSLWGTALSRF